MSRTAAHDSSMSYYLDVVKVSPDTGLKGDAPDQFYFAERDPTSGWWVNPAGDTSIFRMNGGSYVSYTALDGQRYLFFTDTPLDLRSSSVSPAACMGPAGHLVDANDLVWSRHSTSPVQVSVPLCSLSVQLGVPHSRLPGPSSRAPRTSRLVVCGERAPGRIPSTGQFDLRGMRVPVGSSQAAGVYMLAAPRH